MKKKSVGKGWTNLLLFLYNFKYLGIVWKFLVRLIRISFVLDKKNVTDSFKFDNRV
jgi:hypothetical protein